MTVVFDTSTRILSDGEHSTALSTGEAIVFKAIFGRQSLVTFDTLINALYSGRDEPEWSQRVLGSMVLRIRAKIQAAGLQVSFRNVRNVGYVAETAVTIRESRPAAMIPPALVPSLRAILRRSGTVDAANILSFIGD